MIRFLAAAALLLLALTPASAQTPVKITADSFVVEEANSEAIFTGNVVIVRTGLTVWADRAVIGYSEGGISDIESFVATGNVRLRTETQDATGDRARFDPDTQILRLTGNVTVVNDAGTVAGPELVVDLADNTSVFTGGDGARVTGVFNAQ